MKKITLRAIPMLLLAAAVLFGLGVYIQRYIDKGQDWALYFYRENAGSTGQINDRDGEMLAKFSAAEYSYSDDALTRAACFHTVGDYSGRTDSGVLTAFWSDMQDFSLLTGTTRAEDCYLTLTLDADLQRTAYEALAGRKGAVLVSDYTTGELLCLVSSPSIDPLDDTAAAPDGAYINRCLSASFTPGSVFKLITAAAAIENIHDLSSRSFYCEGKCSIAGVEITCSGTHYTQTFEQALANSCNCAFSQIAVMLGHETMKKYVRDYGFLDKQTINGIYTAAGNYPLEFVGDPELGWSGIGQSTDLVCPFSMLRYVSALANGGVLTEPHFIMSDTPAATTQLVNPTTADTLKQLMNYNVRAHYNPDVNFPGLNLCAKTGTAEVGNGESHAWFTGFLIDDAHPYAFVVLVENGGYGLSAAGAVANTVLQAAIQ